MTESVFQALVELENKNESCVLCTIIFSRGSTPRRAGSKLLVCQNGVILGTVGGGEVEARVIQEAKAAFIDGRPRLLNYDMVNPQEGDPGVCGGHLEIYVEPILAKPELLIVGGGHVGKAVAHLARWANFRVIVSDDREEFCNPLSNPDANTFLPVPMRELPNVFSITENTYIVLTTRGTNVDVEGLPALLESKASYIGVIGSKRRWIVTRQMLEEAGIPTELINRVHSPIGLELNAETPEEIAVSILAEIIMLRNGGTGTQMALRS